MKINFDEELLDLEGNRITEVDPKTIGPATPRGTEIVYTMRLVCVRALTAALQEDNALQPEEAFKRLELARKINKGGEQDIDPEDAVLLRSRAAKMYGVQVSGQVYEKLR